MIHEHCWDRWNIYECPICHKRIEREYSSEDEDEDEDEGNLHIEQIQPVQVVVYRRNGNQLNIIQMIYNTILVVFVYTIVYMVGKSFL